MPIGKSPGVGGGHRGGQKGTTLLHHLKNIQ